MDVKTRENEIVNMLHEPVAFPFTFSLLLHLLMMSSSNHQHDDDNNEGKRHTQSHFTTCKCFHLINKIISAKRKHHYLLYHAWFTMREYFHSCGMLNCYCYCCWMSEWKEMLITFLSHRWLDIISFSFSCLPARISSILEIIHLGIRGNGDDNKF